MSDPAAQNLVAGMREAEAQVVERTEYSPYGEVISGGAVSRFDYEGKEYDSVVSDYDFNARKYKSDWNIFTQPDPLLPNLYHPQ